VYLLLEQATVLLQNPPVFSEISPVAGFVPILSWNLKTMT
jgi:hypothetical protein